MCYKATVLAIIMYVVLFSNECFGQRRKKDSPYIEIGSPFPYYKFKEILYFTKTEFKSADLKGKWLVLDCWNRYCTMCIHSFGHMDTLQRKYADKIQFMLVGFNGTHYYRNSPPFDDDKVIRRMYEEVKNDQKLSLPITYDSIFFRRFDIMSCPYIIVINPTGIVRAITSSLSDEQMHELLSGGSPFFQKAYRRHERIGAQ